MSEKQPSQNPQASHVILTPDQRLRVFVSSTLQELAEERGSAKEAITRLRLTPVMFELGARPHPPRELYRAYLEQSHIFIGIYWQRYGWVAPDMEISGLEDEYQFSGRRPKLIYIKKPAPEIEPRLKVLLAKIQGDNVSYKPFTTPDELRELIQNDLALLLTERFEMVQARAISALTAPTERPCNLPVPPTPLVGREAEVAAVCDLLLQLNVRLVTLSGPGGIGKSRLAIEVARHSSQHFKDGACFVPLAPINDPALVIPVIAKALGLLETGAQSLEASLDDFLREKDSLLMLDNFEQVLPAARQVSALLTRAPLLKVLVTSRAVLHLSGENQFAVPPLAFPDKEQLLELKIGGLSPLSKYPAVELFVQSAQRVRPNFSLTAENALATVELCSHLDGLPLAIELAAARIKLFSPQAMHARLEKSLEWLTLGARDLPERQQTLRRTIEWSYGLLEKDEQVLFARLGVFVGGCTLEAVEAVCPTICPPGSVMDSGQEIDILECLASLVDKSLVQQVDDPLGEPRFTMLETIREYSLELLNGSDEAEEIHWRHAAFYLEMLETAAPDFYGPKQQVWFDKIEREFDNVRAMVRWSLVRGEVELVARAGWALWYFWWNRGYHGEAGQWIQDVISKEDELPEEVRGRAWFAAGFIRFAQADYQGVLPLRDKMLEFMRAAGDRRGEALALAAFGLVYTHLQDAERSAAFLEQGLALYRELDDKWGIAFSLSSMGQLVTLQGDLPRATNLHAESVALYWEAGDKSAIVVSQYLMAMTLLLQGDLEWASSLLQSGLGLAVEVKQKQYLAQCLEGLAGVAAAGGRADRAARLWGAAIALREATGNPSSLTEKMLYEPFIARARSQLDKAAFEMEWAKGEALSMAQAIAYAGQG